MTCQKPLEVEPSYIYFDNPGAVKLRIYHHVLLGVMHFLGGGIFLVVCLTLEHMLRCSSNTSWFKNKPLGLTPQWASSGGKVAQFGRVGPLSPVDPDHIPKPDTDLRNLTWQFCPWKIMTGKGSSWTYWTIPFLRKKLLNFPGINSILFIGRFSWRFFVPPSSFTNSMTVRDKWFSYCPLRTCLLMAWLAHQNTSYQLEATPKNLWDSYDFVKKKHKVNYPHSNPTKHPTKKNIAIATASPARR